MLSLETVLKPVQRTIFERVQSVSRQQSLPCAVVGGAIRDALLHRDIGDLDFVVEGHAPLLAITLQERYGGSVVQHPRFRTATWLIDEVPVDFATARSERYLSPAALPIVEPTTLLDDLRRRDFAINCLAVRLEDGALLDQFGGISDLRERLIRALHPGSFVDDPTRIFRAARYAARLGFSVESHTLNWIQNGLRFLAALSGERIKYEMESIFRESTRVSCLAILGSWGVFKSLSIPMPDAITIHKRLDIGENTRLLQPWKNHGLQDKAIPDSTVEGWGAITYNQGQLAGSRWINWLPLESELRDGLVALGALGTINRALFHGTQASEQSALLGGFGELALRIGWLFDGDASKRIACKTEWDTWRWIKPSVTGDDLKAQGLKPGPAYTRVLNRLRTALIDRQITTRAEELAYLRELLGIEFLILPPTV